MYRVHISVGCQCPSCQPTWLNACLMIDHAIQFGMLSLKNIRQAFKSVRNQSKFITLTGSMHLTCT
jgi:hypothetical protein